MEQTKEVFIVNFKWFNFPQKKQSENINKNSYLINRYLNLMQDCLTNLIYKDPPLQAFGSKIFSETERDNGLDWPSVAHTMIGSQRMHNLRKLVESVIKNKIPGDLLEAGVWRGGASIFMRAILEAYEVRDRRVWVADSFMGLPPPNPDLYPVDIGLNFHEYKELAVPLEEVKENFEKYHLLDNQVVFLKGWFKDTLKHAPIKKLALLRLDGDMYESTMVALLALYDKISEGGFVIVDDYHVVEACKIAIHDFLSKRNLKPILEEIDGVGIYWRVS